MVILGKYRPTETVGKLLNLLIAVNIWRVAQKALKIRVSAVQFPPPAPSFFLLYLYSITKTIRPKAKDFLK
jgi:hypothetical protein